MTAFSWHGTDALGLPQHGVLEAESRHGAEARLTALGVSRVTIHKAPVSSAINDSNPKQTGAYGSEGSKLRTSKKQLGVFCRQLANLLAAGIPIVDALETLEEGSKAPYAKLLRSLKDSLGDGLNLGDAMAKHPKVFDAYFLSLVRCEEIAGQLHRALTNLANHLEQTQSLRRKIRQSLLQPGLILFTAILVTWLLLSFVMPEFAKMYTEQNQQLPDITRWVIGLSTYLQTYGNTVLFIFAASSLACIALHKTVSSIRLLFDRLLLSLPLLGPLIHYSNIVDLSRTLAAMLTAGLALNEGLIHAASACRNAEFRRALLQTSVHLENGSSFYQAIASSKCFPESFRRIVRLGEETGKLDHMLEHATGLYQADIQRAVDNLIPLIEPVLMLVLGIIVGGLILAMYLPIFAIGTLLQM